MLNSSKVLSSAEQQEIDSVLTPLLPNLPPTDRKEAFPAADLDMHSVAQQLDSQIAPAGEQSLPVTCLVFQKMLSVWLPSGGQAFAQIKSCCCLYCCS